MSDIKDIAQKAALDERGVVRRLIAEAPLTSVLIAFALGAVALGLLILFA